MMTKLMQVYKTECTYMMMVQLGQPGFWGLTILILLMTEVLATTILMEVPGDPSLPKK